MQRIARRSGGLAPFVFWAITAQTCHAWVTIDFDEVRLPPNTSLPATASDQTPFRSHEVQFQRGWNNEFACCPSGWAISNQTDQVTAGPSSAFAARVQSTGGGGLNSDQFGVVNSYQRGEARVEFPQPVEVQGMYATNVTYTYLATVEGNDGAGFVKGPFAEGDWLRVDVIGLNDQQTETGRVPIYLVDYREGQTIAIDEWSWFELGSLGNNVSALEFEMTSTDVGQFGMNTPAYFAVDDLTFRVVPEPSVLPSIVTAVLIGLGFGGSRRRLSGKSHPHGGHGAGPSQPSSSAVGWV